MKTQKYFSVAAIGAGGAGVESFIELWNPAGSKKTVQITTVNPIVA